MISVTITDSSGPHALGADRRGVLDLGRARAAARGRHQLRARRARDAAVRRGARAHRRRATSAATRTPACRTRSASTTRRRDDIGALLREFADDGLAEHRRRLLRHDARPHPRDRRRRRRRCRRAASARRAPRDARFSGLEPLTIRPESNFIDDRRAHERHRLAEVRAARSRPATSTSALAVALDQVARRRQHPRRQHGRGHARRRARR